MRLQDKLVPYLEYCIYRKELDQKIVKAYRIDLNQYLLLLLAKNQTKRRLRNILQNYIKNTSKKQ